MSDLRPNISERAYQLARGSEVTTVEAISAKLQHEGYLDVNHQLNGRLLRQQLRQIMRTSQSSAVPS